MLYEEDLWSKLEKIFIVYFMEHPKSFSLADDIIWRPVIDFIKDFILSTLAKKC